LIILQTCTRYLLHPKHSVGHQEHSAQEVRYDVFSNGIYVLIEGKEETNTTHQCIDGLITDRTESYEENHIGAKEELGFYASP
jgi:hypothetical protein